MCYYLSWVLTSIGVYNVFHYTGNSHLIKTKFQKAFPVANEPGREVSEWYSGVSVSFPSPQNDSHSNGKYYRQDHKY